MNFRSWLNENFGPQRQQPPPVQLPAQVIMRENNKPGGIRYRIVTGGALILLAFLWIINSLRNTPAPVQRRLPTDHATEMHDTDPAAIRTLTRALGLGNSSSEENLRRAEQDLATQQAQLAALQRQQITGVPGGTYPSGSYPPGTYPPGQPQPAQSNQDNMKQKQREHEYTSLFSSPVIPVRAESQSDSTPAPPRPASTASDPVRDDPVRPPSHRTPSHDCLDQMDADGPVYAVCEGTMIQARLENRVVGDEKSPLTAVVVEDVYSRDRQHVVIPAGTKLLGQSEGVSSAGQSGLMMSFNRVLLPDGRGVDLKRALGLDSAGSSVIQDRVNRHIPYVILTTLSLGGLSALAQTGTGGYYNGNGADLVRQSMGQQAAQTGQQMIGRQLNRLPTITIMEGHLVKLYLNDDLHMPAWR